MKQGRFDVDRGHPPRNLSPSMKITKAFFFAMGLGLAVSAGAAEAKVLKVGTKPESVCRGFGGKLYVTMINGDEPGDGEIKMIN